VSKIFDNDNLYSPPSGREKKKNNNNLELIEIIP